MPFYKKKKKAKRVSVPLKIGGLTALRKRSMTVTSRGNTSVTMAMRNRKGIVTDYKINLLNGRVRSIRPIKKAFRGKIPQSFVDKRNAEIARRRKSSKM